MFIAQDFKLSVKHLHRNDFSLDIFMEQVNTNSYMKYSLRPL